MHHWTLGGTFQGVIERWQPDLTLELNIPVEGETLFILVENMGRVNYGSHLWDPKGVIDGIRLDYQFLFDWTIHPLPLDDVSKLPFQSGVHTADIPCFYRGVFQVSERADTFLELPGWTKGVAYMNGFNLGRYWNVGPQRTLYVPAPLLREGENELVVFELHGTAQPIVHFRDDARWE